MSFRDIRELEVNLSYNREYTALLIVDAIEFIRDIIELFLK